MITRPLACLVGVLEILACTTGCQTSSDSDENKPTVEIRSKWRGGRSTSISR
ncbi:hypothetical protein [Gordonia paraffinivorans]|uniref:hypothetical protein n=1 Tax=Gordonia paraffinivorans TaxID=175628 RepID=UPI001E4EFD9A|nr:hypothetical protein [Gordonia paraffinivorans]MCD2144559.1 hypothetical protein [Gordonia paraffinivorans]